MRFKLSITFAHEFALLQMCCIHGICILAPGANVSTNLIFYPVLYLLVSAFCRAYTMDDVLS